MSSMSIVVPVFNSEPTLGALVARVDAIRHHWVGGCELVLVDDGSHDGSWPMIVSLAKSRPWVRGLRLLRNYGQHNALLCGIRAASGTMIATIDDDLQVPPEILPGLSARLTGDIQLVYGRPTGGHQPLWRAAASRLTRAVLATAIGRRHASRISNCRVFRAEVREGFGDYRGHLVNIDALLAWGAAHVDDVEVKFDTRQAGRSQYTVGRLLLTALDMATGFSVIPLRVAALTGLTFTLFGFAVLVYVLARFFSTGGSIPGFPFIASITAIFSGAQLFALGILGEYLGRTYLLVMDKPAFVVRDHTSPDDTRHARQ